MRLLALMSSCAVLVLFGASVGAAGPSGATRAAAPFAQSWASVPASPAVRRARNIVVFGTAGVISGFNTALQCCNDLIAGFIAQTSLRGAFNQNDKGVWFKDLVSKAFAAAPPITLPAWVCCVIAGSCRCTAIDSPPRPSARLQKRSAHQVVSKRFS